MRLLVGCPLSWLGVLQRRGDRWISACLPPSAAVRRLPRNFRSGELHIVISTGNFSTLAKGAKRKSTASLIYIFVTAHLDQNVISLHANRLLQSHRDQFDHSRQGGHIARGLHFVRSAQLGDFSDLVTHRPSLDYTNSRIV